MVNHMLLSNQNSKTKPCCGKVTDQNCKVADHLVSGRHLLTVLLDICVTDKYVQWH